MIATDEPSSRVSRAILAILVVLHVALAFWYGGNTPYRSAGQILSTRDATGQHPHVKDVGVPDERQHANYVARLVAGEGFPVFDPKDPNLYETYQSHQPPLYYVLSAGYSKVAGLDAERIKTPGGLPLRWLNLLFGATGIVGAYALGRWGFGRRDVGLIAAAFVALLPMNVALDGAVSNDPLLIALCTWAFALTARGVREGWSVGLCVAIGLATAAAAMTKSSALALFPVLFAAALFRRPNLKQAAALLVPALLLPLPWWLRNQSLYGDPFALKAFKEAFVGSPQASGFIEGFGIVGYFVHWVGWWTARSFIGAFGYMDIWLNERSSPAAATPNTLYRLMLALLFLTLVGWVLRLREADAGERRLHALGLVLATVVILQFVGFNLTYFQAQARYLFPALGAFAVGTGWGALRLSKGNWRVALAAVAIPLLAVALLAGSVLPSEFAKRV